MKLTYSSTLQPLAFQERVVGEMVKGLDDLNKIVRSIKGYDNRLLMMVSHVGTGKTCMLAWTLENSESAKNSVNFVVTPGAGGLDQQCFSKLKNMLTIGRRVVYLEEDSLSELQTTEPGDVIVTNYNKIVVKHRGTDDYKSRVSREGENFNLWSLLEDLKARGINVNVFVDEAHYGNNKKDGSIGYFFKDFAKVLDYTPVRVEITATPISQVDQWAIDNRIHIRVATSDDEIRASQLNRLSLNLNDGAEDFESSEEGKKLRVEDERLFTLELAWLKWVQLRELYIDLGIDAIPLLAVQVSDKTKGGDEYITLTEDFFASKTDPISGTPITYESGRLAIRITGRNDNAEDMREVGKNSSPVAVLIYKQAVAMGWDCPRAHILVAFRDIISSVFRIQNCGRFLRTTGARYWNNPVMDCGYIYSNIRDYEVPTDMELPLVQGDTRTKTANKNLWYGWEQVEDISSYASRSNLNRGLDASFFTPYIMKFIEWKKSQIGDNFFPISVDRLRSDAVTDMKLSVSGRSVSTVDVVTYDSRFDEVTARGELRTRNLETIGVLPFNTVHVVKRMEERISSIVRGMLPVEDKGNVAKKLLANYENFTQELVVYLREAVIKQADSSGGNVKTIMSGKAWLPEAARTVPPGLYSTGLTGKIRYEGSLAHKHLYGDAAYYAQRSEAERDFEIEVIGGSLPTDIQDKLRNILHNNVYSWLKNGVRGKDESKEKNLKHFSLAYTTDTGEVGTMYPDYCLILRINGKLIPAKFEVKGKHFTDAGDEDRRFAKARALRKYSDETGAIASAVYKKGNVWMAVAGKNEEGGLDEQPLHEFMAMWYNHFTSSNSMTRNENLGS